MGSRIMEKIKGKNCVSVPDGITAMFLVNRKEEAVKLAELFREAESKENTEFVIASGLTILYRKDSWDIIKT